MLDLAKLAVKIPGVSEHFHQEAKASRQRIEQAPPAEEAGKGAAQK